MERIALLALIVVSLAGCGISAKTRESVIAGEVRARRAAVLVTAGEQTPAQMANYIRAEAEDWAAVLRAIE